MFLYLVTGIIFGAVGYYFTNIFQFVERLYNDYNDRIAELSNNSTVSITKSENTTSDEKIYDLIKEKIAIHNEEKIFNRAVETILNDVDIPDTSNADFHLMNENDE